MHSNLSGWTVKFQWEIAVFQKDCPVHEKVCLAFLPHGVWDKWQLMNPKRKQSFLMYSLADPRLPPVQSRDIECNFIRDWEPWASGVYMEYNMMYQWILATIQATQLRNEGESVWVEERCMSEIGLHIHGTWT